MKGTDRMIVVVLPVLALAIGFWLLVLSPKQKEAGDLQKRIDAAQVTIETAEAEVATAEAARESFPRNYADLVALGTAVPEDDDQATLIYDLAELGTRNSVSFRSFVMAPVQDAAAPPAPAPAEPSADAAPEETTVATPAPATEAAAATLPIGAAVGPAGLPVTPYDFTFLGNFFDMADFFADLDRGVITPQETGDPKVRGRLMTIDGFVLTGDPLHGFPGVEANFKVTTYIVPPEQGIAAGATPAGPAPVGASDASVPTAAPDAAAPAPTAAVAP